MAKIKKSIACLLVALMLLSCVQSVAFASYNEGATGAANYSAFYGEDSVSEASSDQIATMVFDYIDECLEVNGDKLTKNAASKFPELALNLTSIDGLVASIAALANGNVVGGDFNNLNTTALNGLTRANGDLKFLYALIQFLADNAATISKVLTGAFDYGNLFTLIGMDAEEAADIKTELAKGIDVYAMVADALELEEGKTIDEALNEMLNGLLGIISFPSLTGGEDVALDVEIDITTQSLYEIINSLLEGAVKMVTIGLTGQTFSEEDTLGDYLATLIDNYVGDLIAEYPALKGFELNVRGKNLYTIVKDLVDALITNNTDTINEALSAVCDGYAQFVEQLAETEFYANLKPTIELNIADFGLIANHDAYLGFVGELNHILYVVLSKVLTADALTATKVTDGGLSLLSENLFKVIKWAAGTDLVNMIEQMLGIPASLITEIVSGSTCLGDLVVAIANLFLAPAEKEGEPEVGDPEEGEIPEEGEDEGFSFELEGYVKASKMEELAAFLLNYVMKTFFDSAVYDAVIFDGEGGYVVKTAAEWKEIIFSMIADLAMLGIDMLKENLPDDVFDAYLPTYGEGWTSAQKFDEIVDCILDLLDGVIPAIDGLTHVRGELDGNGAWYKLSKVLNSLLPLGIIGGCANTYGAEELPFDVGVLVNDILYGSIVNVDLGTLLSLVTVNASPANVFYTESLFDAVVASVQNIVNGILPNVLTDELVDSMLTAITASDLIQLIRNISASISNRGPKLEVFAARIARLYASYAIATNEEAPAMMTALASITSLEEGIAMALNEFVVAGLAAAEEGPAFPYTYNDIIYAEDGTFVEGDRAYWKDVTLTIITDILVWEADQILGGTDLGMDAAFVAEKKAAGWGYEAFLDEIVDWAFSYLHGFLPAIDNMSINRGVLDGNGAFYKLSKVLNSLLPMSLINDCAKTYGTEKVPFDLSVVLDKVYNLVTELDFAGITDMVKENTDPSNPFSGNSLVKALLIVLQNFANGLLPGTIPDGMLVSIDDTLKTEKLAQLVANLIAAVNGRKQYLIPSAIDLANKFGIFDIILCEWLACAEHDYVKMLINGTTSYTLICSKCGFTFDIELPEVELDDPTIADNLTSSDVETSDGAQEVLLAYDNDAYEEEVELVVAITKDETALDKPAPTRTFNVEPQIAGAKEQPKKPVRLLLPVPEGWDPDFIDVNHIGEGGVKQQLATEKFYGYIAVTAVEFSEFEMTYNAFDAYKSGKADELDAQAINTDSAACQALIADAKAAINAIPYDEGKAYEENTAAVDTAAATIAADLATALTNQRAAEAAAAQLAADKAEFELYKTGKANALDSLAKADDSAASAKLISDAKTAVKAIAYDEAKSLAENKAAADAAVATITTKLNSDLAAQRAADAEKPAENDEEEEEENLNFFQKILKKIRDFFAKIRAFFDKLLGKK